MTSEVSRHSYLYRGAECDVDIFLHMAKNKNTLIRALPYSYSKEMSLCGCFPELHFPVPLLHPITFGQTRGRLVLTVWAAVGQTIPEMVAQDRLGHRSKNWSESDLLKRPETGDFHRAVFPVPE